MKKAAIALTLAVLTVCFSLTLAPKAPRPTVNSITLGGIHTDKVATQQWGPVYGRTLRDEIPALINKRTSLSGEGEFVRPLADQMPHPYGANQAQKADINGDEVNPEKNPHLKAYLRPYRMDHWGVPTE